MLHYCVKARPLLEFRNKCSIFASVKQEAMTTGIIISAILTLMAGIGIFLIACQMMSSNLESASSTKLKLLFSKASRNRMLGVCIGTVGTAAIQSSGATTVMVIGFVNAGIMSLTQAATIIYGANITEYAQYLKETNSSFTEKAISEIRELRTLLGELYEYALKAYSDEDFNALGKANIVEEEIDDFTKKMEDNHIERLSDGVCSLAVGAQYLSL